MILIRDDDADLRIVIKHLPFLKYKIFVDIGIITSRPFPVRWIKKHLHMYEVCNHTHSHDHKNFINWSEKEQIKDIEKANRTIKKKLGITPKYFIPPCSKCNQQLIDVCKSLGLSIHPSQNMKRYYKTSIIGKKDSGWCVYHTSFLNQPNIITLEKEMKYLYKNKLTRFWDRDKK